MAHILIIDDTQNIRKMVALTLNKANRQTQTAANGREGLEVFGDGQKWDLTLVDQQMPELQGDGFIIEARKRDPLARIVMMTAFATPELAAGVIGSGALDFLRKPFTTDTLRAAVEVALSHPRHSAPDSTFDPDPTLPKPGEANFVMPSRSYRMNGFSFWSLQAPPSEGIAPNFALGRLFQVRAPEGGFSSCFVGVTPHIRAQIENEHAGAVADDDPFWDKVCGQTLLGFLAEKAQTPLDVLPVYDVPTARRGRGAGAAA
ncbi:Response regulator receiver domain-containing protein [Abditibacterium utsteinense]|uniref:Response regulator receiver domain-containing protein n=1 Tax=Abditibacterium utsteinense TaxID=1960156 RepID=A0A2S8SPR9_9BACT|nr:response regulator [Abditibacterium utsteinense]PQV62795.1 Response regulator receiver domain-containing protein [Abditibacterium utsteinense]